MRDIDERRYSRVDISSVNKMARKDPQLFVDSSEEYYNTQVMAAATMIKVNPEYRFVLLCGPSASGKTTTAHKLKHRLMALGAGARVVSMDNFYRGMENYEKLDDGTVDMESFSTVDLETLNRKFQELLEQGRSKFPIFDFASQERHMDAHDISLGDNDVLIMEGIHALNPQVLCNIPHKNIFRIYVSVRTKFMCGDETVLVPKDIRLIRRLVRDSKFRSYAPQHTISYWPYVLEGEKRNIDLYRDNVNLKMDNTIDYEVCVWHEMLRSLLASCDTAELEAHPKLCSIFDTLNLFECVSPTLIPGNSLLREFIGEE